MSPINPLRPSISRIPVDKRPISIAKVRISEVFAFKPLQIVSDHISRSEVIHKTHQQDPGATPSSKTHHCFSSEVSTKP